MNAFHNGLLMYCAAFIFDIPRTTSKTELQHLSYTLMATKDDRGCLREIEH